MIEWKPVSGSTRIIAEAYDKNTERIYVRFPNGVEWVVRGLPAGRLAGVQRTWAVSW